MELTAKRQIETGAFYTPKMWADFAVKKIREVVPNVEDFLFWDMCAGEGALIEALPKECDKIGSTLEKEDVAILRSKGFKAFQLDFLDHTEQIENFFSDYDKSRMIVFTNPPFVKLPAEKYTFLKNKYKSKDATALVYLRILNELKPILLCGFNKIDLYQSQEHKGFREQFGIIERSVMKPCLTPSKSWGLKGNFPIAFNIFLIN